MNEIQRQTCIRFRERVPADKGYVNFTSSSNGCFSYVGYNGIGRQLNLAPGCVYMSTIIHELTHAIGFWHMQSATERDSFITIQWANIQKGKEHNFDKYEANFISNFGILYDYNSIMHYGKYAFSSNGKPTIVPKDPNAQLGVAQNYSPKDVQRIKKMYKC